MNNFENELKAKKFLLVYRKIGRAVLPLPHPTSKTLVQSLQEASSGNSFNRYRLSYIKKTISNGLIINIQGIIIPISYKGLIFGSLHH